MACISLLSVVLYGFATLGAITVVSFAVFMARERKKAEN